MSTNHRSRRLIDWEDDESKPWFRPLDKPITVQLNPLFTAAARRPDAEPTHGSVLWAAVFATFAVCTAYVVALFA